ncbi:hypothetical protein [Pseudactinotalea suaedae]|uniref:hypothetical protein n=1 Tax=Pseudactinotalea suaedae TaxID=1524924 RepID=UPI0019D67E8A|nr:hypothetical protein [Pseudactinotalea suaedae]
MRRRGGRGDPIYVETIVRAPLDTVWHLTQEPDLHVRWDLRFTSIRHVPRPDPGRPQEFRYSVRVLPGLTITGTGRSLGERERPDGTRTSALGWERDGALSPLGPGRGYWRYVPVRGAHGTAVRFLTGYDYEPGWGSVPDRVVRPLIGWATAWSFDALRLWAECDQTPERSRTLAFLDVATRAAAVLGAAHLARRRGRVAYVLATATTTALVLLLPAPAGVPRAARCRRRPLSGAAAPPPVTITQVGARRKDRP